MTDRISQLLRITATCVFVLGIFSGIFSAAQEKPIAPSAAPKSTVYVNPRAGADDPRVGLKAGLYDAAEAASGMERIISLPKPAGFAPGNDATATTAGNSDPATI